jgi:hypothetical protein
MLYKTQLKAHKAVLHAGADDVGPIADIKQQKSKANFQIHAHVTACDITE